MGDTRSVETLWCNALWLIVLRSTWKAFVTRTYTPFVEYAGWIRRRAISGAVNRKRKSKSTSLPISRRAVALFIRLSIRILESFYLITEEEELELDKILSTIDFFLEFSANISSFLFSLIIVLNHRRRRTGTGQNSINHWFFSRIFNVSSFVRFFFH